MLRSNSCNQVNWFLHQVEIFLYDCLLKKSYAVQVSRLSKIKIFSPPSYRRELINPSLISMPALSSTTEVFLGHCPYKISSNSFILGRKTIGFAIQKKHCLFSLLLFAHCDDFTFCGSYFLHFPASLLITVFSLPTSRRLSPWRVTRRRLL